MPAPGFLEGEKAPAWLPDRKICEQLVSTISRFVIVSEGEKSGECEGRDASSERTR